MIDREGFSLLSIMLYPALLCDLDEGDDNVQNAASEQISRSIANGPRQRTEVKNLLMTSPARKIRSQQ